MVSSNVSFAGQRVLTPGALAQRLVQALRFDPQDRLAGKWLMALDADSARARIELPCMLSRSYESKCLTEYSIAVVPVSIVSGLFCAGVCVALYLSCQSEARDCSTAFTAAAWHVSSATVAIAWLSALALMHRIGLGLPGMVGMCAASVLIVFRILQAVSVLRLQACCGSTARCLQEFHCPWLNTTGVERFGSPRKIDESSSMFDSLPGISADSSLNSTRPPSQQEVSMSHSFGSNEDSFDDGEEQIGEVVWGEIDTAGGDARTPPSFHQTTAGLGSGARRARYVNRKIRRGEIDVLPAVPTAIGSETEVHSEETGSPEIATMRPDTSARIDATSQLDNAGAEATRS